MTHAHPSAYPHGKLTEVAVNAVEGQFYARGFLTDGSKADVYFEPQVW